MPATNVQRTFPMPLHDSPHRYRAILVALLFVAEPDKSQGASSAQALISTDAAVRAHWGHQAKGRRPSSSRAASSPRK